MGFTVTRKSGGAVRRNRIKRVLREIFRTHRLAECGAFDMVVNAHPSIVGRSYQEVERDFLDCVERMLRGFRS